MAGRYSNDTTKVFLRESIDRFDVRVQQELKISTGDVITFPGAMAPIAELAEALERLTGGDLGWRTLINFYFRQSQFEDS